MTSDKNAAKCRAKDPSTCRYHRTDSFTEKAVNFLNKDVRGYSPNGEVQTTGAAEDTALHAVIMTAMKNVNEEVNENPKLLEEHRQYELRNLAEGAYYEARDASDEGDRIRHEYHNESVATAIYHPFHALVPENKREDPRNFLDPKIDAEPYDKAMTLMIQKEGRFVSFKAGHFGWNDSQTDTHLNECGIERLGKPREASWGVFNGTFADTGEEHGVEATVACKCHLVKGKLRVESNMTDMTRRLVNNYAFKAADYYG